MHIICKALVILCILTGGLLASVFLEPGITWKLTSFMNFAHATSPVDGRSVFEEIADGEQSEARDRTTVRVKGLCVRLVPRDEADGDIRGMAAADGDMKTTAVRIDPSSSSTAPRPRD